MSVTKKLSLHDITMSEEMAAFFAANKMFDVLPYKTEADVHKLCRFNDYVSYYTQQRLDTVRNANLDCYYKQTIEKYGYHTRFGKLLKALYNDKIADTTVETLTHKWNEYITDVSGINIQIWPSKRIKEAYLYKNYFNTGGPLGNSCMRQIEKQPLLNFYEVSGVEIIVLLSTENKIRGRALLWPEMLFTSKKKKLRLMDRVYTNSDSDLDVFTKFAKEMGLVRRSDTHTFYYEKEDCFSEYIWLYPIKMDGIVCTPWSDTMRYLYYKDKFLCNDPKAIELADKDNILLHNINKIITLNSTTDYIEVLDPNVIEDVLTNTRIHKDKAVFSKRYNGYIAKEHIAYVVWFTDFWEEIKDEEPFHCQDESICFIKVKKDEKLWFLKKDCFHNKNTDTYAPKKDALLGANVFENKIKNDIGETSVLIVQNEYITVFTPVVKLNTGELLIQNDFNLSHVEHVPETRGLYRLININRGSKSIKNHQKYFHTKRGAWWAEKPETLLYEYIETPIQTNKYKKISSMKDDERDSWYVQKDKPETLQAWWSL